MRFGLVAALQQVYWSTLHDVRRKQGQRSVRQQLQLQARRELAQSFEQFALALVVVFGDVDGDVLASFFAGGECQLQRFDQRLDIEHGARRVGPTHIHACTVDQQRDRVGRLRQRRCFGVDRIDMQSRIREQCLPSRHSRVRDNGDRSAGPRAALADCEMQIFDIGREVLFERERHDLRELRAALHGQHRLGQ